MAAACVSALLALAGCEAVFTASPFSFLARDPTELAPEACARYAEDALVSGDADVMAAAYAAMQALCEEDPDNPEYLTLAGRLAVELSGMGGVIDALLRGEIQIFSETALAEIEAAVTASVTDEALVLAAATYLEAAVAADADLVGSDYLLGAFGWFLVGCEEAGGFEYLDQPEAWSAAAIEDVEHGVSLLEAAAAIYDEGDTALVFLSGFITFYEQFE